MAYGYAYNEDINAALSPHITTLEGLVGLKMDPQILAQDLPICRYFKEISERKHEKTVGRPSRRDIDLNQYSSGIHWLDIARIHDWLNRSLPTLFGSVNPRRLEVIPAHAITLVLAHQNADTILALTDCPPIDQPHAQQSFLLNKAFEMQIHPSVPTEKDKDVDLITLSTLEHLMFSQIGQGLPADAQWGLDVGPAQTGFPSEEWLDHHTDQREE